MVGGLAAVRPPDYFFFFSSTMPKISSPIIASRTNPPMMKNILCWIILKQLSRGEEREMSELLITFSAIKRPLANKGYLWAQ